MKSKVSLPGELGGELQVSKQEMSAISKFFKSSVPGFVKDGVGILNDNIKFERWKNLLRITNEAKQIIEKYKLPDQQNTLPLNFEISFIDAASQQENPTMQQMWANLLANTSGGRTSAVYIFISILKELSPADSFVLNLLFDKMKETNTIDPRLVPFRSFSDNNDSKKTS